MQKLSSGHTVEPMTGEDLKKQQDDFAAYVEMLPMRVNPGGWVLPAMYSRYAERLLNFKFKSTDLVIATWPKCGTTWMQEILWSMVHNRDLNNPMIDIPIIARSPFIEFDMMGVESTDEMVQVFSKVCPKGDAKNGMFLQLAELAKDPRVIKTHLPFSLLPKDILETSKVVYVARNPKDAVVSYLHHSRLFKVHGFRGSLEDFAEHFINGDLWYGSYAAHLKEAMQRKDHPNLLVVFYEDLKSDIEGQLRRIDKFINTNLTEEQLKNVQHISSFEEMKKRDVHSPSTMISPEGKPSETPSFINKDILEKEGGFFRKGKTGNWKENLTPQVEEKLNKWIKDNLGDLGVDFKYTL